MQKLNILNFLKAFVFLLLAALILETVPVMAASHSYYIIDPNSGVLSSHGNSGGYSSLSGSSTDPGNPLNSGAGNNKSFNWSGYTATGGKFTSVSGTWNVPSITSTGNLQADAIWVGIGGVNSGDLIQAGTQAVADSSGQISYQAWMEELPGPSNQLPLTVNSGDSVTVSISQQTNDQWSVSLTDNTTGKNYQTTTTYNSSLSSADWIIEMPASARNFIPLDNFGTVQFSNASAIKDGNTVTPAQANAQTITMVNGNGDGLATPSTINSDGASFSVSRSSLNVTPLTIPYVRGVGVSVGFGFRHSRGWRNYLRSLQLGSND